MTFERDPLVGLVIGAAIGVHKELGVGLYESVYDKCLCEELDLADVSYESQVALPLTYKRLHFPIAFRADLLVEGRLLVELKAVERLMPVHEAQVLTYMKLAGVRQALLINFNVPILKNGLKSYLNPNPRIASPTTPTSRPSC